MAGQRASADTGRFGWSWTGRQDELLTLTFCLLPFGLPMSPVPPEAAVTRGSHTGPRRAGEAAGRTPLKPWLWLSGLETHLLAGHGSW